MAQTGVREDRFEPAYLRLSREGELKDRVHEAWEQLRCCDLCTRYCRALFRCAPWVLRAAVLPAFFNTLLGC
jgi:NADPH-dependent glutamate synthase beta subunit-like oxidoreductase